MHRAAQAYRNTQINTTSPGEIVVLLFEGAVSSLQKAKQEMEKKNYAQKGLLISKAMDIIGELDSSLNAQKGGDLAQNLHNLYFHCSTRLLQANMNMDVTIVDEVIHILSSLQSAFVEISGHPQTAASPKATANPGG